MKLVVKQRARTTKNKKNKWPGWHHVTHPHDACLDATQVSLRLAPVLYSFGSSTRPIGVAQQVLRLLPSTITTFRVSLTLSSPGDVQPRLHILPSTQL